jgi:hypothetical protein
LVMTPKSFAYSLNYTNNWYGILALLSLLFLAIL